MKALNLKRVLPLVLVIGMLTSACWTIQKVNFSPDALLDNEKGKVGLELYPTVSDTSYGGKVFLLIGYETADLTLHGPRKFDIASNFGGPFDRSKSTPLATYLTSDGVCDTNGIDLNDITGVSWVAYHTDVLVQAADGDVEDPLKINVFFTRLFNDDTGNTTLIIVSGLWQDIANPGVPDAGDVMTCGSMYFTQVSGTDA